jgi:hypothetical protein
MARPHALSAQLLLLASCLAAQQQVGAPKPATALRAGTWKYQMSLLVGDQTISMTRSTTIAESKDGWTVVDTIVTPGGQSTDSATLDKTTLVPRRRTLKQGQNTTSVEFAGNKATGTMDTNGKTTPVAVDLGGSLFADGPGAPQEIACLPLAEKYSTRFLNFDVQKQKSKLMQLTVVGSERVTVPAGTFDAFKVQLFAEGDASKMTFWIDKKSTTVVKMASSAPGLRGATVTSELQP